MFHCCHLPCCSVIHFIHPIEWIVFHCVFVGVIVSFHFSILLSFLFGHAVVFFIHPLVLLFVFPLFVYDCILLHFFLLGMLASFSFIHCFFFFLSFACLCMIAYCCGFCTLLSFGHAVVSLISLWFVSFIQSKELCFNAFFVLGFSLLCML